MLSASEPRHFVNLTDHAALRGHAMIDLARRFGQFEGSGEAVMSDIIAGKIASIYMMQVSAVMTEDWHKLPKVSDLVSAANEGANLVSSFPGAPPSHRLETVLRRAFATAIPALRELSGNATVGPDAIQQTAGNLMTLRDEAVNGVKLSGEGIIGALTRRINLRKADELHKGFMSNISDAALSSALSLTAMELCRTLTTHPSFDPLLLDEIKVINMTAERQTPKDAHTTLSRLNDVAIFLEAQMPQVYKPT